MTPLRLVPPVHRAAHRIGLYLADQQGEALSQGESHILALLAGSNAMTIRQLHEGLAHKRSTLTSILDRLVARGLVTRDVGESDRRTFVVSLTKRGRRVAKSVFQNLHELERAVSTRVSETDIAAFSRVLVAIEDEARSRATADPSTESGRRRRPPDTLTSVPSPTRRPPRDRAATAHRSSQSPALPRSSRTARAGKRR